MAAQCHGRSTSLELVVKPGHGWTSKLYQAEFLYSTEKENNPEKEDNLRHKSTPEKETSEEENNPEKEKKEPRLDIRSQKDLRIYQRPKEDQGLRWGHDEYRKLDGEDGQHRQMN